MQYVAKGHKPSITTKPSDFRYTSEADVYEYTP